VTFNKYNNWTKCFVCCLLIRNISVKVTESEGNFSTSYFSSTSQKCSCDYPSKKKKDTYVCAYACNSQLMILLSQNLRMTTLDEGFMGAVGLLILLLTGLKHLFWRKSLNCVLIFKNCVKSTNYYLRYFKFPLSNIFSPPNSRGTDCLVCVCRTTGIIRI